MYYHVQMLSPSRHRMPVEYVHDVCVYVCYHTMVADSLIGEMERKNNFYPY